MFKPVMILGSGGHAKVITDIIVKSGGQIAGFLDDNVTTGTQVLGFSVLGKISDMKQMLGSYSFVIGIGSNETRRLIDHKYSISWYTAIHPTASIAMDTRIGEGTVIMANAVVNPSAVIGRHCIINSCAVVEHDCVVEDYVHLSPNASIGGTSKIGECTHIGIGAAVINNRIVCSNCIIGAGSVVIRDITEKGTYVGTPVHKLGG